MKALAVALALLCSGVAQALPDGGTDAPLVEAGVVHVDGGWWLSDERFALVGQKLAQPCPAVVPPPPADTPVGSFFYGVATGATVVALAVIAAVVYGATRKP